MRAPFALVTHDLQEFAVQKDLSNRAFRLLVALLTFSNPKAPDAFPGEHKLAALTGMSVRNVKRGVAEVKAKLGVQIAKRRTPSGHLGNVYIPGVLVGCRSSHAKPYLDRKTGRWMFKARLPSGTWKAHRTRFSEPEYDLAVELQREVQARFDAEAEAAVKSLPDLYAQGGALQTVFTFSKAFLAERPSSADHDETRLRLHVFPLIGGMALRDVQARHILEVMKACEEKLAPRTVLNVYSVLSALFREACVKGLVGANPCILSRRAHLPSPRDKDPEWRAQNSYTREEVELIINPHPFIEVDSMVGYRLLHPRAHGDAAGGGRHPPLEELRAGLVRRGRERQRQEQAPLPGPPPCSTPRQRTRATPPSTPNSPPYWRRGRRGAGASTRAGSRHRRTSSSRSSLALAHGRTRARAAPSTPSSRGWWRTAMRSAGGRAGPSTPSATPSSRWRAGTVPTATCSAARRTRSPRT